QLQNQLALAKTLDQQGVGLWPLSFGLGMLSLSTDSQALTMNPALANTQGATSTYIAQLSQQQQEFAEHLGAGSSKVKALAEKISQAVEQSRDSKRRIDQVDIRDIVQSLETTMEALKTTQQEYSNAFQKEVLGAADVLKEQNRGERLQYEYERQ